MAAHQPRYNLCSVAAPFLGALATGLFYLAVGFDELAVRRPLQRDHAGAVHLAALLEALARDAGEGGEAVAVLGDGRGVVVGQQAEVERVVGRLRGPAPARGEHHAGSRQVDCDVLPLPPEGAGQAHVTCRSSPGIASRWANTAAPKS